MKIIKLLSIILIVVSCEPEKEGSKQEENSTPQDIGQNMKDNDKKEIQNPVPVEKPKEKDEKVEKVKELLLEADEWFGENREKWISESTFSEEIDSEDHETWGEIVISWADSSGYFSDRFIKDRKELHAKNTYDHFGLIFFQHNLGQMMHSLCEDDVQEVEKKLVKEGENRYRYNTAFYNVLNSVPVPDQVEGFDWLWDKGPNGETWKFSVVVVKENDQWVIDEIERHMAVIIED